VILVDTSALLGFLKGESHDASDFLGAVLEAGEDIALTPVVVQEVLQGARDEGDWRRLRSYLSTQHMLYSADALGSAVHAARIYVDCRRRGLTVRSATDCLIAQIALEHKVPLLQSDRDFQAIARVRPLHLLP
jgi:predicted nucleic acid-binding protein